MARSLNVNARGPERFRRHTAAKSEPESRLMCFSYDQRTELSLASGSSSHTTRSQVIKLVRFSCCSSPVHTSQFSTVPVQFTVMVIFGGNN